MGLTDYPIVDLMVDINKKIKGIVFIIIFASLITSFFLLHLFLTISNVPIIFIVFYIVLMGLVISVMNYHLIRYALFGIWET